MRLAISEAKDIENWTTEAKCLEPQRPALITISCPILLTYKYTEQNKPFGKHHNAANLN